MTSDSSDIGFEALTSKISILSEGAGCQEGLAPVRLQLDIATAFSKSELEDKVLRAVLLYRVINAATRAVFEVESMDVNQLVAAFNEASQEVGALKHVSVTAQHIL